MSLQNVAVCRPKGAGNTGYDPDCVFDIGFIGGMFFCPDNFKLPTTSIQAAITALNTAIYHNDPAQRVYPVFGFVQPTDSSEAPTDQTFNDGSKARVKEGNYNWTFQFVKGAFCLSYRLRMANGQNKAVIIIDKTNSRIIGTDTGDGMVTAIKPDLGWTNPFKLNDGTKVTEYSTMVDFPVALINDYPSFLDFKNNGGYPALQQFRGLQDVKLSKVARAVAVITVSAMTACGTKNLFDLYGSTLAVVGLWKAYADNNGAPGNQLDITAVATVTNSKGYQITIDTTDPDYTAGAPIWISMAGPTDTKTALQAGYESDVISVAV